MDYNQLFQELQQASLFDLYRLKTAIDKMLDQPDKIAVIKRALRPGQEVTYFDYAENRLIAATVKELKRTRVLVRNRDDGKLWNIPYYMVNIDRVDTDIHAHRGRLTKAQLKIGDTVGYRDRLNRDQFGKIIRLNQKTVTLDLPSGDQWRIPYGLLFPVMDGESARSTEPGLIEGEIVENHPEADIDIAVLPPPPEPTESADPTPSPDTPPPYPPGGKVGRNSPCPCGSGKKFKRCCLGK